MTIEIILGILVIVGTLVGTGLGYALSMRGKREEWAKEYRAKRLESLIDYVNKLMGAMWQSKYQATRAETVELEVEKSTDDKQRKRSIERLVDIKKKQVQALEQIIEILGTEGWRGFFATTELDEQLYDIMGRWVDYTLHYKEQPTDENLEELMSLAKQLLARADEVIIKGGKTPRIRRWKQSIIKVCKKPKGKK